MDSSSQPPFNHHTPPGGFSLPIPGGGNGGGDDPQFSEVGGSNDPKESAGKNEATELIRHKLSTIYATQEKSEPDAVEESVESFQAGPGKSKHQKYMIELSTSGKDLAEIQTAWHAYYIALDNKEKHEVWQEFYAAHKQKQADHPMPSVSGPVIEQHAYQDPTQDKRHARHAGQRAVRRSFEQPNEAPARKPSQYARPQSVADLKGQLLGRVNGGGRLKAKHHIQSLAFGLAAGLLVMLILLFGFFNERFIAPFVTPSRSVSATPLILDANSASVGSDPKIVIPKINVEVPVVYDIPTIDEAAVQKGLERGVVHYATTSNPGEQGNTVIFGHSSNNILNHGKYKFAFVLLSRMENGDTFYIQKDGKRFVYKVFDKKIVPPNQTDVLAGVDGKKAVATLITCDPPGTSINRLVVTAEQISPDPNSNIASTALATDATPKILASNSESLWHRVLHTIF